jgi:NAD(P)-dependent dehydrogenase (short-subunit alcohol dehydrogenase family)
VTQAARPVALITGGSRGIGAAAARALARRGYDIVVTYRNKAARAGEVVAAVESCGRRGVAVACDITREADVQALFTTVRDWAGVLDMLVLNASGGLEREALAGDPRYPTRINRDAQLAVLDAALPLLPPGGVVVFVTSHWAHLYGQVEQLLAYGAIAESKFAGEQALRARQADLMRRGIRLLVVTGDLVDGTITPKLLERKAPRLTGERRRLGKLPTADEMGEVIAATATDSTLLSGTTVVVGADLESLVKMKPVIGGNASNSR